MADGRQRGATIFLLTAAILAGLCLCTASAKPIPESFAAPVTRGKRAAKAAASKKTPPPRPVDLNVANIKELEELPGVGPTTAQAIIDFRQKSGRFRRVEDLLVIHGISRRKLELMRPYVTVGAPPPPSRLAPKPVPKPAAKTAASAKPSASPPKPAAAPAKATTPAKSPPTPSKPATQTSKPAAPPKTSAQSQNGTKPASSAAKVQTSSQNPPSAPAQ